VGIVVNTATALLFLKGRKHDLNVRSAFLHMAADAAVSAGVVAAGFAVMRTGAAWIDPAASLAIVAVIAVGTWGLLKEAVRMALLAVPQGIDEAEVRRRLTGLPGVATVHDLHIWPMSTTETALTAHLVMPGGHPGDDFLYRLGEELRHQFAIGHATIQVETAPESACRLECADTHEAAGMNERG
jgi:cobalt-zinc-cadmium efflux system protein